MNFLQSTLGTLLAVTLTLPLFGKNKTPPARTASADLNESVLLLRNLLKDISRYPKLEAKYRLYLRAAQTFQGIKPLLPPEKDRLWRRRLVKYRQALPLPPSVRTPSGLRFRRIQHGRSYFYWSDAVSKKLFLRFLIDDRISDREVRQWFAEPPSTYLKRRKNARVSSEDQPVDGACFYAATRFAEWFSKQERMPVFIPDAVLIPIGRKMPPVSVWAAGRWKNKNIQQQEIREMFGVHLQTLFIHSKPLGELPEASCPGVQIRLVISAASARKLLLRNLAGEK